MARLHKVEASGGQKGRLKRWTASLVAALPARSSPYTDPGQVGLQMLVRTRQAGQHSRTWLLRFKWKGQGTRIALGHFPEMTLDAARGEARKARELASQGIDPRRARARRRTVRTPQSVSAGAVGSEHAVETLAHEFLERHVKPHRKAPDYAKRIIEHDILAEWRGRDARTITPREVVELLDKIVARGSKVMANRVAGLLSQMFRYGIHRALVESSPVQLLYRPGGREKPRERALTDTEIAALLGDLDDVMRSPRMAHAVKILLATGQRRGELALTRWREISFTDSTWQIPAEHSKTGVAHLVPLSEYALGEFKHLKAAAAPRAKFVFPTDDGAEAIDPKLITRVMARNQNRFKKRGIAPFTAHDLRRTCRTGLAKLGVADDIAERVLNHKLQGMAGVYNRHTYLAEMRIALDKWAAHLEALPK